MKNSYWLWFKRVPVEALIWTAGILFLLFFDPSHTSQFTICPLHHLGFSFCPGCGLGRSIAFLLNGELAASWSAHPLGIPALLILLFRILKLTKSYFYTYGTNY